MIKIKINNKLEIIKKIITICGSMRYKKEMMEVAEKFALRGYCILTPIYQVTENIVIQTTKELLKTNILKELKCQTQYY